MLYQLSYTPVVQAAAYKDAGAATQVVRAAWRLQAIETPARLPYGGRCAGIA